MGILAAKSEVKCDIMMTPHLSPVSPDTRLTVSVYTQPSSVVLTSSCGDRDRHQDQEPPPDHQTTLPTTILCYRTSRCDQSRVWTSARLDTPHWADLVSRTNL